METFAQEIGVLICHRLAGSTVDNHRVQQMVLFHQTNKSPQVERLFGFRQLIAPVFKVQAVYVGQQGARVSHPANAQIDMFTLQPALLALDLFDQRAADAADANDKHFNHLIGIEQHLVGHANAGGRIIVAHDNGNRALGRTLGNRHNVDIGARQRSEEFSGNPTQGAHTIADNRNNRQAFHDRQRLKQPLFQLQIKFIFHYPLRPSAIALRHAEADAVFGRGLGDKNNGDSRAGHSGEHARRHANHPLHPRP